MNIPEHLQDIPLRCSVNGRKKVLPFEEAYRLFWQADFAWNKPTDEFRSGSGKYAINGCMMEKAKPSGTFFAHKLLTRGSMALSINDACLQDEYGFGPTREVFTQNATRFGKCFSYRKLFESTYVCDDRGRKELAYKVRSDAKWIIIMGVAPESNLTNEEIEWEIFQTAPDKALSQSK